MPTSVITLSAAYVTGNAFFQDSSLIDGLLSLKKNAIARNQSSEYMSTLNDICMPKYGIDCLSSGIRPF